MTEEGSGPDLSRLRRLSQNAKPPRAGREVNLGRAAAFLAAALVVVVVPWLIFTRLGASGPTKPAPKHSAPTSSKSPTASPSPSPLADAGVYVVVGDVECARIRVTPGTDQEILNCVKPGTELRSDGQVATVDNFAWLHVDDPFRKIDGWIATKYVKRK